MPDKLIKIIHALEEGDVRRVDGSIIDESTQQRYSYKAYVISNPLNLIRIDVRRSK